MNSAQVKKLFSNVHPVILECLKNSAEARNSHRELIRQVWEKYGFKLTDEQFKIFNNVPSAETIRRQAQKIQNTQRLYRPTKKTQAKRKLNADAHHQFHVEDRDSRYEGDFNNEEYWANMARYVEVGRKALGK